MKNNYRTAVGVMIINKYKDIYLFQRNDFKDMWQCPEGGLDDGEDALVGAFREMEEETGINKNDVVLIAEAKRFILYEYVSTEDGLRKFEKVDRRGYIGQQKKFFLVEFNGDKNKINYNNNPDSSPAFLSFKKVKKYEVLNILGSELKRELYKEVLEDFSDFL